MNNGRKDNRSSCFGRLYYRRLYLLAGKKEKQEVSQSPMGRSDKLRPFSTTRRREKMNRINTVESRVLQILRDSPETRYEDMKLYYRYYNRYADDLRAGELPLGDLAYNYKFYGLPCFESIRRARQRVQSLFPELSRKEVRESDGGVVIVINII